MGKCEHSGPPPAINSMDAKCASRRRRERSFSSLQGSPEERDATSRSRSLRIGATWYVCVCVCVRGVRGGEREIDRKRDKREGNPSQGMLDDRKGQSIKDCRSFSLREKRKRQKKHKRR